VQLDGLSLSIRRSRDGVVSLDSFLRAARPRSSAAPATRFAVGRLTKGSGGRIEVQHQPVMIASGAAPKAAPVWQYQIASVAVANVETEVEDASAARPIILKAAPLNLQLKNVSSDLSKPIAVNLDATLKHYGGFKIDGNVSINPFAAKLHVATNRIDVSPADVYLDRRLNSKLTRSVLTIDGDFEVARRRNNFTLSYRGNLETEVENASAARPIILTAAPLNLELKDVSSDLGKPVALNIDATLKPYGGFKIDGSVSIDPLAAKLHVVTTRVDLRPAEAYLGTHPNAELTQAALTMDGDFEAIGKRDNFTLSYRGNLETEVEGASEARPIILTAAPLNLELKNLSTDLGKPVALNIDAILKPYGGFKIDGSVSIDPLAAKLHVVTNRMDLSPAEAYLGSHLNAELTQAALTMDGKLEMARRRKIFTVRYRGNAALGDLLMTDKVTKETFLRWTALRVSRIDASIGNGAPRVAMGEVVLANFYAPLILNSNGTLNLNHLVAARKAARKSLTRANPGSGPPEASTGKLQQNTAAAPAKPTIDADVRVDRITLQDGAINYTDNFIKPHYTVDLTNIRGKIDGFGTRTTKPADVEIHGLINSVSPIDITGSIDPLAPEAFVDINAKTDGYQLINFTPYSAKYIGYPITMGTLKIDVNYLLQNSQLTARNHLMISRLTFGDKVPSPNAIDAPIDLAVALLKNRRGEIDVTIPMSGSINDPQFSIGALYLSALRDLVVKTVESPFSIMASVAGAVGWSNQNLQYVAFPPGLATLTPGATNQLSILAKAMQSRPGLRLTMTPRVDPSTDGAGLRAMMVDRLVKMQKVEEIRAHGESADVATVELPPDEYDKYLTVVYKQAKFDKPRNFLGLHKSLPPAEMKKLLAENMKVTDDELKKLAIARVVAVGHYLDQHIDPVRLAVVPANIGAPGTKDKGPATGVVLAID
jgi:hypothetical protein